MFQNGELPKRILRNMGQKMICSQYGELNCFTLGDQILQLLCSCAEV